MLTSVQCLVKADELDAIALQCGCKADRDSYSETADGWRRNAVMARHQETWAALHPRR